MLEAQKIAQRQMEGKQKNSKNKNPSGNKDFHSPIWFLLRFESQDTEANNSHEGNSKVL